MGKDFVRTFAAFRGHIEAYAMDSAAWKAKSSSGDGNYLRGYRVISPKRARCLI